MSTSDFRVPSLLQLHDISEITSLSGCQAVFDQLMPDPYVEQGFRYKEIARFITDNGDIVRQSHAPLIQSADVAPAHKGMARYYSEFDSEEKSTQFIFPLIALFVDIAQVEDGNTILFQAQRVKTTRDKTGLPTSEGWHQDGTDSLMSVICVNRQNVKEGFSQISLDRGKSIMFNHVLNPGEMLSFDDKKFWHYVTPIYPIYEDQAGYRDVFLIANLADGP